MDILLITLKEKNTGLLTSCNLQCTKFSFLNKVFVAARKHNTKRNTTGFILYACDSSPLNSRVKKKS